MEFRHKVVMITGAAGYIGKATAKKFKQEGALLSLIDIDGEGLEDMAAELNLDEDQAILLEADIGNEKQVIRAIQETLNAYQRIDVLFNNAGIEGAVKKIFELTAMDLDQVYHTNMKGSFLMMKHVLSIMEVQKEGVIINAASIVGLNGAPCLTPYVMSKHAIMGMTKSAAVELAETGIRINSICPGYINSRMMMNIESGIIPSAPQYAKQMFTERIPMKRYGNPDDVADLVLFLSSERAKFITGSHFSVDGGLNAL